MTETEPSRGAARRTGSTRLVVGYLAVLAMLPYLVLKLAWVSGSPVGIADEAIADQSVLMGFNALTLGMDLVAVLVVLAFTHSWGQRMPAWSVLLPTWVASGLLTPIVIAAPVTAALSLWTSTGDGGDPSGLLEPWVRPMVYTSFVAQGIGIAGSFLLYAGSRWRQVFTRRIDERAPGVTQPVYVFGAALAAVLVAFAAVLQLLWALGSTVGMPAEMAATRQPGSYVVAGVYGLLGLAGIAGLMALVHQRPRGRLWPAVLATWVGAGSMWAWGTWTMLVLLADTASGAELPPVGLTLWVSFTEVVAGLVVAVVGLLVVVETVGTGTRDDARP